MKMYTEDELKTIANYVKANPENLTQTFKKVANILGRSHRAIEIAYYKKVKNNEEKLFSLSGNSEYKQNTKVKKENPENVNILSYRKKSVSVFYEDVVFQVGSKRVSAKSAVIS